MRAQLIVGGLVIREQRQLLKWKELFEKENLKT